MPQNRNAAPPYPGSIFTKEVGSGDFTGNDLITQMAMQRGSEWMGRVLGTNPTGQYTGGGGGTNFVPGAGGNVAPPPGGAGAPVAVGGTPGYVMNPAGPTAISGAGATAGAGAGGASSAGIMSKIANALGLGSTAYGLYELFGGDSGGSAGANVNLGGGSAQEAIGMMTLLDILLSQGKTDPRALNREKTTIARQTEAEQQRQSEQAARMGLSGFAGMPALQAAIGAGGTQQIADAEAREAQIQEQRKRDDLNLLLDLIIGPDIQRAGIQAGIGIEDQRNDTARTAALLAGIAQLMQGASGYFNTGKGGA